MPHRFAPSLITSLLCWALTATASFDQSEVRTHPGAGYAGNTAYKGPFVLEIVGTWPDDCHPGEQKPVIREYDGASLLVEFDIIVEHITCNDFPTPYRVLVDLSDVAQRFPDALDLTVRFGETEWRGSLQLRINCALLQPCEAAPATWPESGLYDTRTLPMQGLVLARQAEWLAAYPLTYDDTGSSEWLFAANRVHQNVMFSTLFEATGGDCLGCPSNGETPVLGAVGKLTLFTETQGRSHLKLNDGLFIPYDALAFGYGLLPGVDVPIPDLSGRWALARSDTGPFENGSIPPLEVLPGVVDVTFAGIAEDGESFPLQAQFTVTDLEGNDVTMMRCLWDEVLDCLLFNPDFAEGDHAFRVETVSPTRLRLTDTGPILAIGVPATGELVRVD